MSKEKLRLYKRALRLSESGKMTTVCPKCEEVFLVFKEEGFTHTYIWAECPLCDYKTGEHCENEGNLLREISKYSQSNSKDKIHG